MEKEPDEKRQRKRTSPVICPVCSVTIREHELENHFRNELDKLGKIKRIINKSPCTSPGTSSKIKPGESSMSKNDSEENWDTYQKIKENRVRRSSKVGNFWIFIIPKALFWTLEESLTCSWSHPEVEATKCLAIKSQNFIPAQKPQAKSRRANMSNLQQNNRGGSPASRGIMSEEARAQLRRVGWRDRRRWEL